MRASAISAAGRHLRYLRDRFAELWERRERTARIADLDCGAADRTGGRACRRSTVRWSRSEVIDGGELLANIDASWQDHRTRGGRHGTVRGVPRGASGGPVAAARSAVNRVVGLARRSWSQGARIRAGDGRRSSMRGQAATTPLLARALCRYASPATFLNRLDDAERALTEVEAIPANFGLPSHSVAREGVRF